jgi:hypothetical protein
MSMGDNDLLIKINADAKNAIKAFDDIKDQTEDVESVLTGTAKVSAIAFAALTAEIGFSAKAFAESEAASRSLSTALQNQGIFSNSLLESYKKQAEALEDLTGIDDDVIVKGQALLQTFVGQTAITKEMTAAAIELGTANGGDVASGFEILGRAINGQTRGLKQFGISISETLPPQERLDRILSQVTVKLGGQAAAANQGLSSMRGLQSAFGDVQEEIGKRFAPAITFGIEKLTTFFKAVKENDALLNLVAGVISGGAAIALFVSGLATLGVALISAQAVAAAFGTTLAVALGPIGIAAAVITALGIGVGVYVANASKAADATAEFDKKIQIAGQNVEILRNRVKDPIARFFNSNIDKEFADAQAKLVGLQSQRDKFQVAKEQKDVGGQDQNKLKAAEIAAAEKKRETDIKVELNKQEIELLQLQNEHASEETIGIKQREIETLKALEVEQNETKRGLLQQRREEEIALEDAQGEEDIERMVAFEELSAQTRQDLKQKGIDADEVLRAQDVAAAEASLQTKTEAERKFAKDKLAKDIADRNQYLQDEIKFGATYAALKQKTEFR